jgi:hypothetical protein
MKKQKRRETKPAPQTAAPAIPAAPGLFSWPWWYWLVGFGALFLVFEVYGPALRGPFVLDDLYLPYADVNAAVFTLFEWLKNLRPLLMLSFWLDFQMGGSDPHVYHITNVLLHFCVSILVTLIAARFLEWTAVSERTRQALAIFAGALFLLHPLQTESVAYVASRSDVLSVLFYYAAFAVFIYSNRDSMSVLRAIAVVTLFGAAAASKEHTLTLPMLILLTDLFWHRGGWRANKALYSLLAVACAAGAVVVARILMGANTAGFGMKDLSPVAYFFTQCRILWIYIRLFFLPFGQNVDPDLPISQGPLDHGAIFGLVAFLAVIAAAWIYRRRWPLASYGVFIFLLLIAPTSSVVPIRDVLAERRVYLPFLGLIFIALEILRRLQFRQMIGAGAAILAACTILTYQRSDVWSSPLALWKDTVAKSPRKMRPLFHLAFAQYQTGDCGRAVQNFEAASHLDIPDYRLQVDWANALDCAGRADEAAKKYSAAIAMNPFLGEAYVGLSAIYGKQRKFDDALQILDRAQAIDPTITQIYLNRGGVYELLGNTASAIKEYERARVIEPSNRTAREALRRLGR